VASVRGAGCQDDVSVLIVAPALVGLGVVLVAVHRLLAKLFDQHPGPLGPQLSIVELRAMFIYIGCALVIIGADLLSNVMPGLVVGILIGYGGVLTHLGAKIFEAERERSRRM
jgi:hypothetical protein